MARIWSSKDLFWRDNHLHCAQHRRPLATLVPDQNYAGMWRIRDADGQLTDMANRTRAADAAIVLALRSLNAAQERHAEAA